MWLELQGKKPKRIFMGVVKEDMKLVTEEDAKDGARWRQMIGWLANGHRQRKQPEGKKIYIFIYVNTHNLQTEKKPHKSVNSTATFQFIAWGKLPVAD